MNISIETKDFKFEAAHFDRKDLDKIIVSVFQYVEGGSFVKKYANQIKSEESVKVALLGKTEKRTDATPRLVENYITPVNGVRTHNNGGQTFKCSYSCTCGHTGVRYVDKAALVTSCHKCKTELGVFPATSKTGVPDDEDNYFVAY